MGMLTWLCRSWWAVDGPKSRFAKQALAALQPASAHILFSSISAMFGSPGQANYACANAALDSMASHSASIGMPTCSIQWGPWSGGGMAAAQRGTSARLATLGLGLINPSLGLQVLQQSLVSASMMGVGVQGSTLTVVVAEWARLASHSSRSSQLLSELTAESPSAQGAGQPSVVNACCNQSEVSAFSMEARPTVVSEIAEANRRDEISNNVTFVISSIMGQEVSPEQPLMAAGLESLSAVEVRNSLQQRLSVDLPATVIFDYPTPKALAGYIAQLVAPISQLQVSGAQEVGTPDNQLEVVPSHIGRSLEVASQSYNDQTVVMATGFAGVSPGMPDASPASGDCVGLIPLSR